MLRAGRVAVVCVAVPGRSAGTPQRCAGLDAAQAHQEKQRRSLPRGPHHLQAGEGQRRQQLVISPNPRKGEAEVGRTKGAAVAVLRSPLLRSRPRDVHQSTQHHPSPVRWPKNYCLFLPAQRDLWADRDTPGDPPANTLTAGDLLHCWCPLCAGTSWLPSASHSQLQFSLFVSLVYLVFREGEGKALIQFIF